MKHQGLRSNSYGQIDDLKYTYFGNQLLSVTDVNTQHGPADFRDNGATNAVDYTYNANGSLVTDANKGITAVVYNHLDLPEKVSLAGGREIVYLYDAAGTKLAKVVRQAGTGDHRTDYVGEFVYQDGVLEFFATPDGRCVADGGRYRYEYHYRDHLGNLRLAFSDLDGDGDAEVGEVLQEAAYYPYGMRHEGLGTAAVGAQHRYLFQGKELERDFGVDWMDFGARRYDAQVGRWWGVDALAGKRHEWTPFRFCLDNPMMYTDPAGMLESTEVEENGDGTYHIVNAKNDGDNSIYVVNQGIRTGETIGKTLTPFDFMSVDAKTDKFYFDPKENGLTFDPNNATISGKFDWWRGDGVATTEVFNGYGKDWVSAVMNAHNARIQLYSGGLAFMSVYDLAMNSRNGEAFDIKKSLGMPAYTPIRLSKDANVITSLRAIGNFAFGANLANSDEMSAAPEYSYALLMRVVGLYNQYQNGGNGFNSGWPFYGESQYSGTFIFYGFFGYFPWQEK